MGRIRWAATLGVLTGLVGLVLSMIPSIATLEDTIGLRWLFLARGPIEPPRDVTIVSIDEAAAARLGLGGLPREWPRSTHAALVDRLVARGATTIVFDVEFFQHSASPADDEVFARAIARSGRVVLVQRLEVVRAGGREMWERQDPIPPLAGAAAALAPAPVPEAPFISWFWSFLKTSHAGDVPSLPAVVLQLHLMEGTDQLIQRLRQAGASGLESLSLNPSTLRRGASLPEMMQTIRRAAVENSQAVSRVLAQLDVDTDDSPTGQRSAPVALARLYAGAGSSYLNFYGPPGTICTIPYDVMLNEASDAHTCSLQGAVVFVGLGTGRITRAGQDDSYHTVYGGEDDVAFSGVEIHATALSNLLAGATLHAQPAGASAATLMMVGIVLGATGYGVRTRRRRSKGAVTARVQAAGVLGAIVVAYSLLAYFIFSEVRVVMPLVVPLACQFPTALILGLLMRPVQHREQVEGVCLVTDAAGSTALGQRLPHRQYARLMSEYNETLSKPVWGHGGEALSPQGDGFVCLWYERAGTDAVQPTGSSTRLEACRAALKIAQAAERFNLAQPDGQRLPTRIGITVGTVTIYSDADRGVFSVFGDTVNVAARLRDLNVQLGTSVLASQEVVDGLEHMVRCRPVSGSFAMKGVVRPPSICEIAGLLVTAPDGSGTTLPSV